MSIIERAIERLDKLKQAGAVLGPASEQLHDDRVLSGVRSSGDSMASSKHSLDEDVAGPVQGVGGSIDITASGAISRPIDLDIERLHDLGMVTPSEARSNIAEEFRVIKRPLLRNLDKAVEAGRHGNLIMITSAVPGEGKSFSAINLAISIAMELDHTVLLIDADVARPSVLNILGLAPSKGLMDVLLSDGDIRLPDVLLKTNIEKLSILPAGASHQRSTELLASDAMNQLVAEIATRYSDRVVIFDSPPLLATTEARVLASHMGQVVMVVEAGKTTQGMVNQALSTIETCPLKLMLLNKTRDPGSSGYYGYHYGPYGYGSANPQ